MTILLTTTLPAITLLSTLLLLSAASISGCRPAGSTVGIIWHYPELRIYIWLSSVTEMLRWAVASLLQFLSFIGLLGVLSGRYF